MISKGLSLKDAEINFGINASSGPKDYCKAYLIALQSKGYFIGNANNRFNIGLTLCELSGI